MDYWALLLLILAVPLSSCGAGAQSTIATISTASDTTTDTTNTAIAATETDTIPTASYITDTTVFPTPRPNSGSTTTTTDPNSTANTNAPTTITPPPSSSPSPSPISALTTTAPTTVSTVPISNANTLTSSPTATLLTDTAAPTSPTSITPTPISNTAITKTTATTRPPLFTPPPTTFTTSTPRTPPTTPNLISNATTNINITATTPNTVTSADFTTDIMTPSPPAPPSTTVTTYTSTVSPTTSPATATTPTSISSSTTAVTTPTPLLTHTTTTFVTFSPATPISTTTTIINTTTTTNATTLTITTTTPTYTTTTTTPTTSPTKTTISTTTTTTATTTTPPPPPSTTLKCENDGVPQHGICVCPDKWTGDTCSVENFCRALNYAEFHFPETLVGWFAYSVEFCQEGNAAGTPKASTRCSIKNGSPAFELPPNILQCDQTLNEIQQNLTSGADLEFLAANTQILTSIPEQLTTENITAAAQIADTLLRSPNATENVRVAAVATISQLLNTSTPDDSKEINATLGLTMTLEQFSVNLSRLDSTSQSQVVQPNLVVHSAQIPAADTQGVQFTSLSGVSGSFVANRIQLKTNVSKVEVENGIKADAMMFVRFPPEAGRQRSSNVSMGFVLYQNDRFFRSKLFKRERITFRVLSATIQDPQEHSVVPQRVEMQFSPTMLNGTTLYDFACVFWDYKLEDWNTVGCSKGNASDNTVTCFCNHTTNFAALWSFRENYDYSEALDYISILGLSISILGLVVTIVHHIRESFHRRSRQQNSNPKVALLCIFVSQLAFIITFLSGVQNFTRQNDAPVQVNSQTNTIPASEERVEPDRGSCSAVAALLQFFLLSAFVWSSVYSTQLVLLVRTVQISLPSYCRKLSLAVGWGIPATAMAITLGATYRVDDPLGYRQEEFCWLAALDKAKRFDYKKPMFWGFVLPLALILVYNLILLILASMTTCCPDPRLRNTKTSSLRKRFLISFSLAVLLGLSWTLGYLVLLTSEYIPHLIFSILFCLCTTTQGFQIFILFTARTPTFKAVVSHSVEFMKMHSQTYSLMQSSSNKSSSETYRNLRDKYTDDPMSPKMETSEV